MTHCQSSEVPAEDQQQKEHVEDLERFSNCLEFWIQNLLIVLTVLGDCHPKNLGKPPDILPRGRSKSQTILVLLKSIYGWILNSSWWLYTATGQNKGGPPKAQPLSSKSDRFWKTRCWNVEALTSTMFTFHLYIYISLFNLKKTNCCAVVPCSFWCWWWHVGKPPKSPPAPTDLGPKPQTANLGAMKHSWYSSLFSANLMDGDPKIMKKLQSLGHLKM